MENFWRRADYNERQAIEDFSKDVVSVTKWTYIGWGAMWEFIIICVSVATSSMKVSDEPQIVSGIILGLFLSLVNAAICGGIILYKIKRAKKIEEGQYLVTEATILDKHQITGRSYERGFYIKFRLPNDKEHEVKTSENNYDKASLDSRAVAVFFNQDEYFDGFYGEYDIVIVE